MNEAPGPVRIPGEEIGDGRGNGRFRSILGRSVESDRVEIITERWHDAGEAVWQATWIDAGTPARPMYCADPSIVHVLWTEKEHRGLVSVVDWSNGYEQTTPIGVAPGDTIAIPAETPFFPGPGGLYFILSASPLLSEPPRRPMPERLPNPTHGLQVFHRYNRRTICTASPDLVLERWKLTQPQAFALRPDRWHLLVNLVDPVALAWPGGSIITSRASSWLLSPGMTAMTVVPDNLGYVLVAYRPELEQDVIEPLRTAGYDPETIASIGVPRESMNSPG